jgi:hypothetical protein
MAVAVVMNVTMVVGMSMVVGMTVPPTLGVGALLGREGRLQNRNRGAEPLEHRDDHVIVADAQTARKDLDRQMTIAEMPGETRERRRRLRNHVADLFVRGHDLDDVARFQDEAIARAEDARLRQVEQESVPVISRQSDATPVPVIEIEGGEADPALAGPGAVGHGFDDAAHDQNRK